jgi:hypothetical protein
MKITIELTHTVDVETQKVEIVWADVCIKELPIFSEENNELVSRILEYYRNTAINLICQGKTVPGGQPVS